MHCACVETSGNMSRESLTCLLSLMWLTGRKTPSHLLANVSVVDWA